MTLLDIQVPPLALAYAGVSARPDVVDAVCAGTPDTLDDSILLSRVLGLDTSQGVDAVLAGCPRITVPQALYSRGGILIGTHGRVGVAIGLGVVIEPCGRGFALTPLTPARWVAAYWPPTVVATLTAWAS